MIKEYTLREAEARLSELLDLAAAGVVIEISRQGAKKGRFKLVPNEGSFGQRSPGALKCKIVLPDDFDAEDPKIIAGFKG